jgi:hypothetical protein
VTERDVEGWAGLSALPTSARGQQRGPGIQLECEGETFEVGPGEYGGTHYEWLSGPNTGYGFTTSGTIDDMDEHETNIRSFLSMIDPETGYIAED